MRPGPDPAVAEPEVVDPARPPLRRGPRQVLGLLREDRWRRGLALAVAVACVCVLLGQWQWHRREERLARNAPLVQNYDRDPVAVTDVLPSDGSALTPADAWTPVRFEGRYDGSATVLVRNRPRDEAAGYDVLVPLVLPDGTRLVVDRGWIPAGADTAGPDSVPAPPSGPVTVLARLRPWEEERRSSAPPGQVPAISRTAVTEALTGLDATAGVLLGGYAVLAVESPGAPDGDAPLLDERPAVDEGPHLAYTVQWYGFALTALVVWVIAGRRELEQRAATGVPAGPGDGPGDETPDDETPDDETPGHEPVRRSPGNPRNPAPTPPPTRTQTRRRDIVRAGSDEEAEDAEVEARTRS